MTAPDKLSPAEVAQLTGVATARGQAAWLAKRHIPFTFNGSQVVVVRAVAEAFEVTGEGAESGPRLDLVT